MYILFPTLLALNQVNQAPALAVGRGLGEKCLTCGRAGKTRPHPDLRTGLATGTTTMAAPLEVVRCWF